MKFQYVSDIHLEFRNPPVRLRNTAPYLILAGDIGRLDLERHEDSLKSFLKDCVSRWKRVIYVPGNHEFYGLSLSEGKSKLRDICRQLGVTLLAPGVVKIDNVTVVGDILWSNPENECIFECISDGMCIVDFNYNDYIEEHEKSLCFLRKIVSREKCIVVTHHAPDLEIAKHPHSDLETCFGTDILDTFDKKNIIAWIYGHTHMNKAANINGVELLTNQMGYPDEITDFDENLTYAVDI